MFKINNNITSSENTQEDSYSVFKKAVNNGQTRLALEALVDVIDAIIETLISESDPNKQTPEVSPKKESKVLDAPEKAEETTIVVEEKTETSIEKKKTKDL